MHFSSTPIFTMYFIHSHPSCYQTPSMHVPYQPIQISKHPVFRTTSILHHHRPLHVILLQLLFLPVILPTSLPACQSPSLHLPPSSLPRVSPLPMPLMMMSLGMLHLMTLPPKHRRSSRPRIIFRRTNRPSSRRCSRPLLSVLSLHLVSIPPMLLPVSVATMSIPHPLARLSRRQ